MGRIINGSKWAFVWDTTDDFGNAIEQLIKHYEVELECDAEERPPKAVRK
jgi:hypothetical protein